jgi:excisionase family DNA binding protein
VSDRTFTVREAAEALGVEIDRVYSLLWSGRLDAEKIEGVWAISVESVHKRKAALRRHAGSPQHVKPSSFRERVNS